MPASDSQRLKELYEFGPFRVDPEKEILLRAGEPVPLTPKTFQILLVLIRHSKEVVTKDDLMKAVWPDTFVEEANLSRNIFMLRKALGESPQDHQYIITVPGRGYRLAESVRLLPQEGVSIVAAQHSKVQVQVKETRPWGWILVAVIVLVAIAAGALRFFVRRTPVLSEKDTVVLADFVNTTGDPVFDGTLRQGMSVQLEQSPFLSLVSDQRIQRTLGLMGQPPDTRLTPQIAREICERTGSVAVLNGSIANLGSRYVLGLQAKDCHTGDVLDEEQAQPTRKEEVLNGLDQIASKFRRRVGESLMTIQQHNTPLADATTPSLEALKAFSMAERAHYSIDPDAALALYQRAIEIDSNFAMAYAGLGHVYGESGESDLSAEATSKAYELRNRASDQEKFFITLSYELRVTGNLDKAQQTCGVWARTYPRDTRPHGFLSSMLQMIGQHERSIEEAKKTIELDPDFAIGYVNLAAGYQNLGRFNEAEDTLRHSEQRKLQSADYAVLRYQLAFLKSDKAEMDREAIQGESKSQASIYQSEALALAYSGHLQRANEKSMRAADLAQQAGQRESAALFKVGAALWNASFGYATAAKQIATEALKLSKDREVEYGAAFAFALAGDYSKSRSKADDLERRFGEDTSVRFNYLPSLRALLVTNVGRPSQVFRLLDMAHSSELGTPRTAIHGYFGALYPVYVRGLAYLAGGNGSKAVPEFQKILDHRGVVVSDPIGALAHLQLGRAYAMAGNKAKAKSAYQDFLELWKDADPSIPILKQAKSESVGLQ
jgi:DNA-binding winged helix-turn-helix (wHTH) protein/lipopolysaccharide biosynthesis regulator YciM